MGVIQHNQEAGQPWPAPPPLRVGIIGAGPTGMLEMERLIALASLRRERPIQIIIFEPNTPGAGLHSPNQPEHYQLNTIADQLNVFPGSSPGWELGTKGPSLYQHLAGRQGSAHYQGSDYAPRHECGAYLVEAFDAIRVRTPDNVSITVYREQVKTVVPAANRRQWLLKGSNGTQIWVDRLCLCLGHVGRKPRTGRMSDARVIEQPYPLPDALSAIRPDEEVAVQGLGLVASDVITALTRGRGGRYEMQDGVLTYVPSGKEPIMWMYSRSGIPFRARPYAPPERQRHQPLVLTRQKIDQLREDSPNGPRLDFVRDILPLLKLEMSAAYQLVHAEMADAGASEALRSRLAALTCLDDPAEVRLKTELDALNQVHARLNPDEPFAMKPPPEACGKYYPHWVRTFLVSDLGAARLGLLKSPHKAALEVCRDVRDIIRYAVDFDGLTDVSHREFYRVYAPLFNRLVGGPAMERNQELVALLDVGILRLPPGPIAAVDQAAEGRKLQLVPTEVTCEAIPPIAVDWVVEAHDQSSGIIRGASGPVRDLHDAGLLTTVQPVLGLDGVRVDRLSRPIDAEGRPVENLAVLGPLTEGARFYNHYIATAGGPCRLVDDADIVARRMLGLVMPGDAAGRSKEGTAP